MSDAAAERARRELAKLDPAMAELIERIGPLSIESRRRTPEQPFDALARIIVGQQVSTAAARTIWERVVDEFGGRAPRPEEAASGLERLRACGLSGRKASYVAGLGEAFASGELEASGLERLGDGAVVAELTRVRGIGTWSAEMFLMFHLGRRDVFSAGDLGLRQGIRIALGLDEPPSPDEAAGIAERWRPQRTLASIYLWAAVAAER